MYATIHSAEITHRQQARELAKAAEFARIRAERPQDVIVPPSRVAKALAWLRPARTRRPRVTTAATAR